MCSNCIVACADNRLELRGFRELFLLCAIIDTIKQTLLRCARIVSKLVAPENRK